MIRSFEKTHSKCALSPRAALNNRIPIIAVSASLVERERQTYIDAGFDAWILKPISFDRLQTLLKGIVDPATRGECLYRPGKWEIGGWFDMAQQDARFEADTAPDAGKQASGLETAAVPQRALEEHVGDSSAPASAVDGTAEATTDAATDDPAVPTPVEENIRGEDEQQKADQGVQASDKAYVKSASAPAAMTTGTADVEEGSDENTPKAAGEPAMLTDEVPVQTPEVMPSPPPAEEPPAT